MERADIQKKFEPLRKKYKKWVAPVLTSAEQAQNEAAQETVERVAQRSAEDFLERGSKLPLELNARVTDIVEQLHNETGTLEETQLALEVVQTRFEEAQDVRVAADNLELLTQEGERQLQQIQESFEADKAEDEAQQAATRKKWEREDQARLDHIKASRIRLMQARTDAEEKYVYDLERKRRVALDGRNQRKATLIRTLGDQDITRTSEFDAREEALIQLEGNNDNLREEIEVLKGRLDNEPNEARVKAISEGTTAANQEAKAVAAENAAEIATKDREIELSGTHINGQQEKITALEAKIAAATTHNQHLSQLAMGGQRGQA